MPAGSGTVHAGLNAWPMLSVPFRVLEVDEAAMEWSWEAHLGPLRLRLEHGVTGHPSGSATWLRVHGPLRWSWPTPRWRDLRSIGSSQPERAYCDTTSVKGTPMPTFVWVIIWAVVILTVAALYVRERRSGRDEVGDFDRHRHEAVREAGVRADIRGPGAQSGGFGF